MKRPTIIPQLREIDSGSWDLYMSDFSSNELEEALDWCLQNDPNLFVLIQDELAFRAS